MHTLESCEHSAPPIDFLHGDGAPWTPPSNQFETVTTVCETARDAHADFLLGLGGGKAIDVAKLAADELDLDLVSVPTAASHDGIVSGRGSIPEGDTRRDVLARRQTARASHRTWEYQQHYWIEVSRRIL